MTALTATYSSALGELIKKDAAPIDGIEIGPWYRVDEIERIQRQFADWTFQFHAGSVITRWQVWPGARRKLARYLGVAHGEWISVHLELLPWHVYLMSTNLGLHLDPPPAAQAVEDFLDKFERFSRSVKLPILLENLPSLPIKKYHYAADPVLIQDIVQRTESGMVLDIAHARIAASYRSMDITTYLSRLPLDRVQQIHVSGVGREQGMLHDHHEELSERDYELLQWTLEKTQPRVVTLEYFREKDVLRRQLARLRRIVGE